MRLVCLVSALILPASLLAADWLQTAADADTLHDQGKYADAKAILLEAVKTASGREASELSWRASREAVELGNKASKEKLPMRQVLVYFDEGETYAEKAIQADPDHDFGYFWKGIAILGRLGQVGGLFNALSQIGPVKDLLLKGLSINPDRALTWFLLGQLYREAPGWPISFGDGDIAVSLGRKAVDLNVSSENPGVEKGATYNFQVELAKSLYSRNWSAARRLSAQKEKAQQLPRALTIFEKAALYEATVTLEDKSDRQEAKSIVQEVIAAMETLSDPTASQSRDLQNAKQVLTKW